MCGSLLENGRFVVRLTGRGVEMGEPIYRKFRGKFRNEFRCNFSEAKTFYKVRIGAIFARNVFLEAISGLVLKNQISVKIKMKLMNSLILLF